MIVLGKRNRLLSSKESQMAVSFLLADVRRLRNPKALQAFVLGREINPRSGSWQIVNFPSTPDGGWEILAGACPFVEQLVCLAERLGIPQMDILFARQTFCGLRVGYEDTLGPLAGRQGFEYTPWTFCWRLLLAFAWALEKRKDFRALEENSLRAGMFKLVSQVWGLNALSLGDNQIRDTIGLSEGNSNCPVSPQGGFQGRQA